MSRIFVVGLLVLMSLFSSMVVPLAAAKPQAAPAFCECTQYVYAKKGLSGSYGHAHTWDDSNGVLPRNGYRQYSIPQVGDVVVFSQAAMGNQYGHVAIITAVAPNYGPISVRGANQGGSETEGNCNNVNTRSYSRNGATFWRK